jgi:hypothetical protein
LGKRKGETVLTKIQKIISTVRSPDVMPDVKMAAANTVGGSFIAGITWNTLVAIATFVYFVVSIVYVLIKCHKAIKGRGCDD